MMERIKLNHRCIGLNDYPYVIAEIGSNHNGDMGLCRKIIDAAIDAEADAVKFQSWTPDSLVSKMEYARNTAYSDTKKHFGSLETMIKRYAFTEAQHREIAFYCRERGITFLSSAFSPAEVELLESLDVPMHKIASMDIDHFVLLKAVAETGKPVILSTGMATLSEIDSALEVLEKHHAGPVILLHCVSLYPPSPEVINLNNIKTLQMAFGKWVGFSDHTLGVAVPLAAVALGAVMIEKHFTIDKDLPGWDHAVSANPNELAVIVRDARTVFQSLGSHRRIVTQAEWEQRKQFRRCIVTRSALNKGDVIGMEDVDFKRPGTGIKPSELQYLLGRKLAKAVQADHELAWEDIVH